jgi:hypothetical protein
MKTPLSLFAIRIATFALAVAVGIGAHGATSATTTNTTEPGGKKKKAVAVAAAATAVPANGNEAGLLDQAYGLLARADHDYKGHRARAMHKIEEAAKALGSKLGGHGKGDEQQGTSDTQMKSAQSLLEQAVGGLTGKPHHHIEEAIKQLNIALSVK